MKLRHKASLAGLALGVLAAGAAYAAIPDAGGVFHACMKRSTGEIRLIDTSAPLRARVSHCNVLTEDQISWNQTGPPGTMTPGTCAAGEVMTGVNANGTLLCTNAVSALRDPSGAIRLTSPNGVYTVRIADSGVEISDNSHARPAFVHLGNSFLRLDVGAFNLRAEGAVNLTGARAGNLTNAGLSIAASGAISLDTNSGGVIVRSTSGDVLLHAPEGRALIAALSKVQLVRGGGTCLPAVKLSGIVPLPSGLVDICE